MPTPFWIRSFRLVRALLLLIALLALSALVILLYTRHYANAPGPLTQEATVIIEHGSGFSTISETLAQHRVITMPRVFELASILFGGKQFIAGEYKFPAGITPQEVAAMLREGKVVIHKLTVAEGLTAAAILALVDKAEQLKGTLPDNIEEGSLLPETYYYQYGDTKEALIQRMQKAMEEHLTVLWIAKSDNLPLKNQQEALILASLVEKETGIAEERPRVAAVFINRLRKGMKLQCDPTVAYGLEKEKGPLMRALTHADLETDTPYNTYMHEGLPPTPIANPGKAALEAALRPANTNELYFVANGTGGHSFAATLEEHNKNVAYFRQLQKAN